MTLQDLLDTYFNAKDLDITLCTRGYVTLKKFKLSDYNRDNDKEIRQYLNKYVKKWWITSNILGGYGIVISIDFEQYT